jgi:hypothetical protein
MPVSLPLVNVFSLKAELSPVPAVAPAAVQPPTWEPDTPAKPAPEPAPVPEDKSASDDSRIAAAQEATPAARPAARRPRYQLLWLCLAQNTSGCPVFLDLRAVVANPVAYRMLFVAVLMPGYSWHFFSCIVFTVIIGYGIMFG